MVFNSISFLLFFAGVLFLHHLPISWTLKKMNLLLASYLFYAAWNPPFVLLLILAAAIDFYFARLIFRSRRPAARRLLLIGSLALNLGLLGFFKYGEFLLDNFITLARLFGVHYQPAASGIVLPLGISFYTFETISYLVDVYRRKTAPWPSFLDYALFLTFFPHLVAGPIVRANDFLPQCAAPRRATADQMGWGLALLFLGLFEKVVLADSLLAPVADHIFGNAAGARFFDAWTATLAFTGQIFFDFAGYSTCGIGVALCLGFVLKDNFRYPYAAVGFSDFWQRWHISLSSWLRDYLYVPLGGSRRGTWRTYVNLMLTMLLGGLWHGASWRFVAWGGLHGCYLVGERLLKRCVGEAGWARRRAVRGAAALSTFLLVAVAWVFFRAPTFGAAFHLLGEMANPRWDLWYTTPATTAGVVVLTGLMLATHAKLRDGGLERLVEITPWWARSLGLTAVLVSIVLWSGEDRAFIYFQF